MNNEGLTLYCKKDCEQLRWKLVEAVLIQKKLSWDLLKNKCSGNLWKYQTKYMWCNPLLVKTTLSKIYSR